jgi:PKD domain
MSFLRSLAVVVLSVIAPSAITAQIVLTSSSNPSPPIADAGSNQTTASGSTVVLNGSGSSNPSGTGTLGYRWEFSSVPPASKAALKDASSVMPSFTLDVPGAYVIKLTVDNGAASSSASVTISSAKSSPVAQAGPNQTVAAGSSVKLNGGASSDVDGHLLTYSWSLILQPPGSTATLTGAASVSPSFTADLPGTYVAQLIVNDGTDDSFPSSVTITTGNTAPVANAGPSQIVSVGTLAQLSGAGSSDINGDSLSYQWTLVSMPAGSTTALSSATAVNPTFTADVAGTYIAQLIVNDGTINSSPATVLITTNALVPPVANASLAQVVSVGSLVQLNGAGSTDVDGALITYRWSLVSVPAGSAASLSSTTAVNPTFTVDVAGAYVAQLIVNDGTFNSSPATVVITTNALVAPVANAGPNQTVTAGSAVSLSGAGTDPQGMQVTFLWALIAKPTGSAATFSDVTSASPSFVADLPGTYIAQLIVNDGSLRSAPSTVAITTGNTPPVANAAPNQSVLVGATVTLDASRSSDANQDPLTFSWSFLSRPNGSAATLSDAHRVSPTFVADIAGTYVMQVLVNDGLANSNPATVVITAAATAAITLTPNPLNLGSNGISTLSVILSMPAGPGGQAVTLASSDTTIATVTGMVTIPENATGANSSVMAGNTTGSATITASAASFSSGTAAVNVVPPSITVSLGTGTVGLSRTIGGRIVLNTPAPSGGITVTLSSDPSGVVDVQTGSVTIEAGSSTGAFTVKGLSAGSVTITASASGYASGSVAVTVVITGVIELATNVTAAPGETVVFPFLLTPPAPAGGIMVTLASNDTSKVTVTPSSILVAEGATTPAMQPQVSGVNFGFAAILASAPGYQPVSRSVQVTAMASFFPPSASIVGTATQGLTLNLSAPAPAGGLTMNLSSSNPSIVAVPPTASFAANSTSTTVPVKGVGIGSTTIHANALPGIADTSAGITVVSAGTIALTPKLLIGPGQSVPFSVTLPTAAPADGAIVTLTSSDPSKFTVSPATVAIAAGQTSPTAQPQVSGVNFGSASITASAPGYVDGSATVQVTATLSFFPVALTITGITTQNLTLNLSSPAPLSGLTVNLSSNNASVSTVPATVFFEGKAASVTVPVTAVALGTAIIRAGALPSISETTANVSVVSPGTIVLPSNVTVGPGQSTAFPVTLSAPAPPGGVTIALLSSDVSKVTITPASVLIPAGSIAPATQPRVNGGTSLGSATITASAPGYSPVTQPVNVGLAATFSPASLSITGTVTQNLTLTLSAPAPAGGLILNLSSSNPAVASVPATINFAANATSATVPVTGVGAGTATIHASAFPAIPDTTATVTVNSVATSGGIAVTSASVGQNLEVAITVALPQPAASGGTQVTLTSSDQTKLLIAGHSSDAGSSSLTITVPEGATTLTGVFVQALAGTGTATVTASAPNLSSGVGTITITPSGFVLLGPNGSGAPSLSTSQGIATTFTVAAVRLDATLSFAEVQPLRGGTSVKVTVDSSSASVGTISGSPVTFSGGDQGATVQFTAVNAGSTTVTAGVPTGFNIPAQGANTTVVSVSPAGLVPVNVTVGKGLETAANILLNGVTPAGGLQVNLTSNSPGKVLLSATPNGAGTASLVVSLAPGVERSPDFYVYGVDSSGSATYTASAPGFGTSTGTVTLAQSGFIIAGPNGVGSPSFSTTAGAARTDINVYAAVLGPGGNPIVTQAIAGGTSVTLNVASSNPSVGTITTSPVTISGGNASATTQFQPTAPGNTNLSVSVPPGFSFAQNASVIANVITPGIAVTDDVAVGQNLQTSGVLAIGQLAPAGGLRVTLTSNNPSQLLLSSTATSVGSSSITLTIPPGANIASYFIQALGNSGTATYTASVPGYTSRTGTIPLTASGAVLAPPLGLGVPFFFTTVASGAAPFTVSMAQLNPDNSFGTVQQVAGGKSVTVSLNNTSATVGSIASPVTIAGGSDSATANFTPISSGSTTISVVRPTGYAAASNNTSVAVTVR